MTHPIQPRKTSLISSSSEFDFFNSAGTSAIRQVWQTKSSYYEKPESVMLLVAMVYSPHGRLVAASGTTPVTDVFLAFGLAEASKPLSCFSCKSRVLRLLFNQLFFRGLVLSIQTFPRCSKLPRGSDVHKGPAAERLLLQLLTLHFGELSYLRTLLGHG